MNVPYLPGNGVVFEARVQAQGLAGGSRGWGFWNTNASLFGIQQVWFIQFDGAATGGVKPLLANGFYAVAMNGAATLRNVLKPGAAPASCYLKLADLDENPHDYRIEMGADQIVFSIDGQPVAQFAQSAVGAVLPMAIHYWVDNALFGVNGQGQLAHITQKTAAPRANIMQTMRVRSVPLP